MASHKIVVASVAPDAQAAVTSALASTLAIAEPVAMQIAESAPIVILDGLAPDQATAILEAMGPVRQAGAQLVISAAASSSMAQINWQAPPKVAGRDVASYRAGHVPPQAAAPAPRPPSTGSGARRATAANAISFACPHCGRPVQVMVRAPGAPVHPSTGTGIQQVPVPPGLVDQSPLGADFPGAPLPEVPNVPPAKPPERPPSASGTRAGPMDLEEFEKGVGGGKPPSASADALLRQLDASLPAKDPGLRALEQQGQEPPPTPRKKKATPSPRTQGSITNRRFRDRRR